MEHMNEVIWKPAVGGGGKIMFRKKIVTTTHCTTMIRRALHSPDLGECFTYPKHDSSTYRKFSRGPWSPNNHEKQHFLPLFRSFQTAFKVSIKLENVPSPRVCVLKNFCRHDIVPKLFFLTSLDPREHVTYPQCTIICNRNFSRATSNHLGKIAKSIFH